MCEFVMNSTAYSGCHVSLVLVWTASILDGIAGEEKGENPHVLYDSYPCRQFVSKDNLVCQPSGRGSNLGGLVQSQLLQGKNPSSCCLHSRFSVVTLNLVIFCPVETK